MNDMKQIGIITFYSILCLCCNTKAPFTQNNASEETVSSGKLLIGIDIQDSIGMQQQIETFEFHYPNAKISAHFASESAILDSMMEKKLGAAVLRRELTETELNNLEVKLGNKPVVSRLAKTAIAVIASKAFGENELSLEKLTQILSETGNIKIYLESSQSSILYYLFNQFLKGKKINAKNLVYIKDMKTLIKTVSNTPNAIGFIGSNWITDQNDELSESLYDLVKTVKIQNPKDKKFYGPWQSQVGAEEYPFVVTLNYINLQHYQGLGFGFCNFMTSQPGQVLFKKSRFVPLHTPPRTIQLTDE